jgi:hemerythrin-like domain-containing protein
VDINLNRKLLSHGIIEQLRDTVKAKGMVAGSAITELLDEYDRMRYLMEGLITAYNRNDEQNVRKILEVLRVLL